MYMRVYALVSLIERIKCFTVLGTVIGRLKIIPACRTVLNVRLALNAPNLSAASRSTTEMERFCTIAIYHSHLLTFIVNRSNDD